MKINLSAERFYYEHERNDGSDDWEDDGGYDAVCHAEHDELYDFCYGSYGAGGGQAC